MPSLTNADDDAASRNAEQAMTLPPNRQRRPARFLASAIQAAIMAAARPETDYGS
jgi:hypothetical protein